MSMQESPTLLASEANAEFWLSNHESSTKKDVLTPWTLIPIFSLIIFFLFEIIIFHPKL